MLSTEIADLALAHAEAPAERRPGRLAALLRLALWPLLLLLAIGAALCFGRYPLALADLLGYLGSLLGVTELAPERQSLLHNLIVNIRLPRILTAALVGAALSVSGAAFQGVFRNPLVSPNLLGVLAGAAFGAALGMLLSDSWLVVQLAAFGMGLVAVAVGVGIAQVFGRGALIMLVLGGIVSGALFTALLSIVKYAADPYNQLPAIVYWLMGSFAQAELGELVWIAPPLLTGVALLCLGGRSLDALAMGDEEARTLGVPVTALRYGTIALATLVCALSVATAGMIGWVGLLVPHVARLLVGPAHARLLPVSAFLGASFMLFADGLARNLFAAELPIGIVTELLGIPAFVLVLHRVRRGWA